LPQDDKLAVEWYRKAAEQGHANAQNSLGVMYVRGRGGLPQDDKQAVEWYRKAAEQGNAYAQNNLGVMYANGRGGLPQNEELAVEWYRKAAEQGNTDAQAALTSLEQRGREQVYLSRTVPELVKRNEKDLSAAPVLDAERVRLAREVIDASGVRETYPSPEGMDKSVAALANKSRGKVSAQFLQAMGVTLVAAFTRDQVMDSFERRLAESVDTATLRVGLQWEGSDLARRMQRLEQQTSTPEGQAAMEAFAREQASKGGRTDNPRARACAQADTLADKTESAVPMVEAMIAGLMIGAQQPPVMDMDGIRRAVVGLRPLTREVAREVELIECLFTYRDLSDAEIEQWLEFLRSDSGGHFARGFNDALRDAMLDRAEVFTRTLTEVMRQMKGSGTS
jgi:hypothetical protein